MMNPELINQRGLSMDRLVNFAKVAQAKSVTKAAGGDAVTQSQYSRQIKELESFFGVKLINRTSNGMSLTSKGEELHGHVSAFLTTLGEFKNQAAHAPKQFALQSGNTFFDWFLLPKVNLLHKSHPSWQYTLSARATADIINNVATQRCDLGIIKERPLPAHVKKLLLGDLKFRLYVPAKLLGNAGPAKAFEIGIKHLALPEQGSFRRTFEAINEELGLEARVLLGCRSFTQAQEALQTGHYAALLPISDKHPAPANAIALNPDWLRRLNTRQYIIWNARHEALKPEIVKVAQTIKEIA